MTVEDLKSALEGKTFPDVVNIGDHQIVSDVDKFLKVQFIELEQWKRNIEKCPAYVRLMAFYNATR